MKSLFIKFIFTLAIMQTVSMNCFSQKDIERDLTKIVPLNGKVINKEGFGIPKVLIGIYGTTTCILSEADGSFELLAPKNYSYTLVTHHPKFICESFPVKMNSTHTTLVLTDAIFSIDFIKKEFNRSADNIFDREPPKLMAKMKDEEIPEESLNEGELIEFFFDDFPKYPGGEGGFWKRYDQQMDSFLIKNEGESQLLGIYHGTFKIDKNGLMQLQNVYETISKLQKSSLQKFFLSFGNWEPVKWYSNVMEIDFNFIIRF